MIGCAAIGRLFATEVGEAFGKLVANVNFVWWSKQFQPAELRPRVTVKPTVGKPGTAKP